MKSYLKVFIVPLFRYKYSINEYYLGERKNELIAYVKLYKNTRDARYN